MRRKAILILGIFIVLSPIARSQDAVPVEILNRTFLIRNGDEYGTAFTIDVQGAIYLVTARHMTQGLPPEKATIQVWGKSGWTDYPTIKTLFPPSDNVDIAVFATKEKVQQPYGITLSDSLHGITLGQQVWFLGFPYQLGSKWSSDDITPFIKRGTMSAVDAKNQDAVVFYIDGFNNPGFSGGPIVYWNFDDHQYHILAVTMGYKEDTAKVLINGQHVDTQVLVNTGILVGYSAKHILQALEGHDHK